MRHSLLGGTGLVLVLVLVLSTVVGVGVGTVIGRTLDAFINEMISFLWGCVGVSVSGIFDDIGDFSLLLLLFLSIISISILYWCDIIAK
jgi:hypothetical protein